MGIYTVQTNSETDKAVETALNRVVDRILSLMDGHLDAIVLTGGFGRGEGGVICENGRFRPVNDFDIVVIVSKGYLRSCKRFARQLQELGEKLTPVCGVKQMDIGISHPLRFRFAPNLVESYEIRNGHKVLWGDIDLKQLMPPLPAERLPLLDGAIYFLSRGSGLLIPALYFLPNRKVARRHRENLVIELDKACIAIGDALLLLRRQYHYSYVERQQRMEAMDMHDVPEAERVRACYVEAVQRKLRPQFDWAGDTVMMDRWFWVRDLFGRFFLRFEGRRLKKRFEDWEAYSRFVEQNVRDPLGDQMRRFLRVVVRSGIFKTFTKKEREKLSRKSQPFRWATMPTILFSLERDNVDSKLMNRGRTLLSLRQTEPTVNAWEETARVYLAVFHREGVVKELLQEKP
ncbi:hypothetical protein ES702_00658 [subsurface metagenome]